MRLVTLFVGLLAFTVLAGCASVSPLSKRVHSKPSSGSSHTSSGSYDPKTKPYTVMGKTYYPLQTAAGYDEVGKASWYGKDFHGKKTANGQIYNMYGVSAAHKTLPLGTKVRVTNLENHRTIELVVNDRGPFVHGRILDLSYGAAKKLGTVERGVAKIRITAIGSVTRPVSKYATAAKYYHVRVGAFSERSNAERTLRQLKNKGYKGAKITTVNRGGRLLHIVQAGSYTNRDKAESVQERLKDAFPSCYIVS